MNKENHRSGKILKDNEVLTLEDLELLAALFEGVSEEEKALYGYEG